MGIVQLIEFVDFRREFLKNLAAAGESCVKP